MNSKPMGDFWTSSITQCWGKQSQSEFIQPSCFPDSLWEADCVESARLTLDGVLGGESASGQRSGRRWRALGWPLSPSVLKEVGESVSAFAAPTDSLVSAVVSLRASAAAAAAVTQILFSLCKRRKIKERVNTKANRRTNRGGTQIFIHANSSLTSLSVCDAWYAASFSSSTSSGRPTELQGSAAWRAAAGLDSLLVAWILWGWYLLRDRK